MNGFRRRMHAIVACGGFAAGCSSAVPPPSRPQPIAYADTLPIAEPAVREVNEVPRIIRTASSGEVSRAFGLRAITGKHHEALNIDRFDEVPNSAWFEHRNGRDRMSPEEVFRGSTSSAGPSDGPLTIVAAKVEGISPGYTVEDALGNRYVVKFDPKGFLYLSSGAGVISNRLLHAAGFHVPEDYIFSFSTDRLLVDPDAKVTGEDFIERPLSLEDATAALDRTDPLPDGRYVAVASKFVPGPPKGPFFFEGRRADDPNDHYRHEGRRELRGLFVVSSWINHIDMRFMNTMDAYVPPGYLRHHLIDFAATLGSGTIRPHQPREGLEYNFDAWDTFGRLFTLGFHRAGWEAVGFASIHPQVGWLRGDDFDPGRWKPNWPNKAFNSMTLRDAYWGAKLVGAFDDSQIRAAVEAGGLPDPFATDTLTTILITRRDKIVDYWYSRISPVENPEILETRTGGALALSFDDLGIRDRAWGFDESRYEWSFHDPSTGVRRTGTVVGGHRAERIFLTVPLETSPAAGTRGDGYATIRIRIERGRAGVEPRSALVYLRWAGDRYEVVGLEH